MSSYSKQEIYNLTRRLYYLIRNHGDRIDFKKLSHGVYGYYETETEEITIDYRRQIVPTLIHEFLHHIHPDWCETKVLEHESKVMNSLSPKQIRNIIKVLGENI